MLEVRKQEEIDLKMSKKSSSMIEINAIKKGKFTEDVDDEQEDDPMLEDEPDPNASIKTGALRPDARPRPLPGCHPDHRRMPGVQRWWCKGLHLSRSHQGAR